MSVDRRDVSFDVAHSVIRGMLLSVSDDVSGVYRMISDTNVVLYVGKAQNIKNRLCSYLKVDELSDRGRAMVSQISKIEITVTKNEVEALLLEAQLIKSLKPRYNIVMRDDKFYPYILLSEHAYPRILKYNGKVKRGGKYYGPFTSSIIVKHVIVAIRKAFLLRSCSDSFFSSRKRACIEYEVGNCSAPCVGKISKRDYAKAVDMAHAVLVGKSKELQVELFDAMRKYSGNLDYESAILCRDRLHALQRMQECMVFSSSVCDADFVALYRRASICCIQVISFRGGLNYGNQPYFIENLGKETELEVISMFILQFYSSPPNIVYVDCALSDACEVISMTLEKVVKRKVSVLPAKSKEEVKFLGLACNNAMEALNHKLCKVQLCDLEEFARVFKLSGVPERIEVFDNSHISGTYPFGVMVVCGREGMLRKEYRKFKIRSTFSGDDYSMIAEVMKRRFAGKIGKMPDFLLIDGGPGHVSVVSKCIGALGIPFACMAKGPDRIVGKEVFYLQNSERLFLEPGDRLMLYMQRIRDEAHRFALSSHRRSRDRGFLSTSVLNSVPGIGQVKRKAILAYFGSIDAVRCATVEEICKVPGISMALAKRIAEYLVPTL